jgi:presenilin-like A22 family membrane protease
VANAQIRVGWDTRRAIPDKRAAADSIGVLIASVVCHFDEKEYVMSAYQTPPAGPPAQDPGRTMGIVGLILAIFCSLIGLIVSAIAYNKSKKAGYQNNFALAGIIIGIVSLVLGVVINFTVGFPFMNQG